MIPYLPKTPDWSNEELNAQEQDRREDRQGWWAERGNGRRNLGEKDITGQPHSQPQKRVKVDYRSKRKVKTQRQKVEGLI